MASSDNDLTRQFSNLVLSAGNCNAGATPFIGHSRNWIRNGEAKEIGPERRGVSFTAASYNVLSPNLLARHLELYAECNNDHLEWDYRKQKLLEEIDRHSPDILCLQEVHMGQYWPFFLDNLNQRGYHGIYKQRPGNNNEDGCATFFKASIFKLVEYKTVVYDNYDASCQGKCNIALLTVLSLNSIDYNSTICVANTHLLYNPRRGDIKMTQIIILLAEIDQLCWKHQHQNSNVQTKCPFIVCGDLNLIPHSELYLFLCRGIIQLDGLYNSELSGLKESQIPHFGYRYNDADTLMSKCNFIPRQINSWCQFRSRHKNSRQTANEENCNVIYHDLNLSSAYPHDILDHPFTSYHSNETPQNIDYILYSVSSKTCRYIDGKLEIRITEEGRLHLLEWLEVPTIPDHVGPLPNAWNGSDHIMIMSRFLFL